MLPPELLTAHAEWWLRTIEKVEFKREDIKWALDQKDLRDSIERRNGCT
jgi:hypothetical protein